MVYKRFIVLYHQKGFPYSEKTIYRENTFRIPIPKPFFLRVYVRSASAVNVALFCGAAGKIRRFIAVRRVCKAVSETLTL